VRRLEPRLPLCAASPLRAGASLSRNIPTRVKDRSRPTRGGGHRPEREQRQAQWVLLPCRTERPVTESAVTYGCAAECRCGAAQLGPTRPPAQAPRSSGGRAAPPVGRRAGPAQRNSAVDYFAACLRPFHANRTDGSRALGLLCAQPRSAHMGGRAAQRRPLRYVGRTD
jgi:hypothetical protein